MIPLPPVSIPGGLGTAGIGLLVALVVGVVAGRSGRRFFYLVAGLVVAVVVGIVLTAANEPAATAQPARIAALYGLAVPLVVAFLVGWLGARAGWFFRVLLVVVGVVVLAAFPYTAVAAATAGMVPGG